MTVGFRLAGKSLSELVRQSEALGVSPGELSRAVVERHLEHDESRVILEALETLNRRHEALAPGSKRPCRASKTSWRGSARIFTAPAGIIREAPSCYPSAS